MNDVMDRMRAWAVGLFCVSAVMMTAGCRQNVDLGAIRALAASTDAASSGYAALAQDFGDSCDRKYEWDWASARTYAGFPTLADACGANTVAAAQWQRANQVLVSYVRALGALAGGDDTETDFGIPGLVDAINGAGASALSAEQTSAISTAATDLVSDIFNIRRRNEIAKYAPKADADLDQLIRALQTVATNNYARQLDLERDAIDHFYQPVVASAAAPAAQKGSARRGAATVVLEPQVTRSIEEFGKVQLLTLRQRYREDRAELDTRRGAIDAYVRSLSSIRAAHQALVKAIESNDISHVGGIIQSYVAQLKPDVDAISKAFPREKP